MPSEPIGVKPVGDTPSTASPEGTVNRLRILAANTSDPFASDAACEAADLIEALTDRVLFLEAARHHDRADIDRLLATLAGGVL
jgi:hypothetical protein